jgi:ribosome biogenesis GTPase
VDLVDVGEAKRMFQPYEEAGYRVVYTSVVKGVGLGEVLDVLKGKESALVGPSGVGKSSLLNALYPGLNLKVGQISEAYGKGRHTTVGGLLIKLPDAASVADTAGLREVGLWLVPPDELPHCFPEFREYLGKCRFSDCAHVAEPGCAVREAVEAGEIEGSRYESYLKLRAEAVAAWPRW